MEYKVGDILMNEYEVIDVKGGPGKSGFGIVYICYGRSIGGMWAIKSFQDRFFTDDGIVNAFYREAEVWVKLGEHKNIVRAFGVGDVDGKPHILLKYIDGGSLRDRLEQGKLGVSQSLYLAIQFCSGMIYANSKDLGEGTRGIVHRDIKPENIMLTKDGVLKITDFGLVKTLGAPTAERPMGTPEYMSPEQFRTMDVDQRSDIYSFGVVLYEMLSGRPPFSPFYTEIGVQGMSRKEKIFSLIDLLGFGPTTTEKLIASGYGSLEAIAIATPSELSAATGLGEEDAQRIKMGARWVFCKDHHQKTRPRPLKRINPLISKELELVVKKCLEKNPDDRYQNFRELRNKLMDVYMHHYRIAPEIKEKDEPLTAAEWYNRGYSLAVLGRSREAIECFDRALEMEPRLTEAWAGKGATLLNLNRPDEALTCLNRALETEPLLAKRGWTRAGFYTHTWCHKGVALLRLDRPDEAVGCFNRALEIDSRDVEAWTGKGAALLKLNRFDEALACCDRALEIDPNFKQALKLREYVIHRKFGLL